MPDTDRERWGSGRGFLLAALGSAVGLGNIWRFSYIAGENGGGAFLLIYLLMVLLVGVPLLLGEFALGRSTQRESASALEALAPGSRWRRIGLLGVLVSPLVLAYYAVIAGWVLKYLSLYALGTSASFAASDFAAAFHRFIAHPLEPLAWQFTVMLLTMVIVAQGIERGIELASTLLMPLLALLLLALALHNATLPGFARAIAFLFQPDWRALLRPDVYLAALGQAFFSIGLAMGVMVTYGSYLARVRRLPGAVLTIALGDTLVALMAGLVIFPAVFSFGLDPAQGPALAFVVLPGVFSQMPGGMLVGVAFFALLGIAALTSSVSLLEVPVAFAMQRFGWTRRRASLLLGMLIFMLGIPASLGFGPWADLTLAGGRGILDAMDFVAVNLLLPLSGLLLALFVGWVWQRQEALAAADLQPAGRLGRGWHFSMRYIVPLLVAVVLVSSLWSQ